MWRCSKVERMAGASSKLGTMEQNLSGLRPAWMQRAGSGVFHIASDLRGMFAFFIITLSVALHKFNTARNVVHPAIRR